MKIFFSVAALSLASISAHAGDLYLVCFQNQDRGDYVGELADFDSERQQTALGFQLPSPQGKADTFTVSVKRESLFRNYTYEITRVSADFTIERKSLMVSQYDTVVKVLDSGVECQVTD